MNELSYSNAVPLISSSLGYKRECGHFIEATLETRRIGKHGLTAKTFKRLHTTLSTNQEAVPTLKAHLSACISQATSFQRSYHVPHGSQARHGSAVRNDCSP